jgi:hypothetical protein
MKRKRCGDRTFSEAAWRTTISAVLGDRFVRNFDPTFEPKGMVGVRGRCRCKSSRDQIHFAQIDDEPLMAVLVGIAPGYVSGWWVSRTAVD